VRTYAAAQRQVERFGPFLATFGLHSTGPYLNYAVPDDRARPTDEDVETLVRAYEARGLRPRVELVPALAPGCSSALLKAGFRPEGTLMLMACDRESLRDVEPPSGTEVVFPSNDDQYLALVRLRQEAFEEEEAVGPSDVARARLNVESGGVAVVVYDTETGEALGSGACLVPYRGVTELTSVGVRPRSRRRGIGALVTGALTRAALLAGSDVVFLTPAHDEGERVYARVGFVTAGESLHMAVY